MDAEELRVGPSYKFVVTLLTFVSFFFLTKSSVGCTYIICRKHLGSFYSKKKKACILSRHKQYSSDPILNESVPLHNIATVVRHKNNLCDNKLFYVLIFPI